MLVLGSDVERLSLCCAHVGDCRAVMCRGGAALRLTQDHRPDRKDEQTRIRAAGGGVFQVAGIWRCTSAAGAARAMDARAGFVENESHTYLSCSRTLGDPELKANPERPILSNTPDTTTMPVEPNDLFFVIACDGVWDVLGDQQVGSPQAEPEPRPRGLCEPSRARAAALMVAPHHTGLVSVVCRPCLSATCLARSTLTLASALVFRRT